VTSQSRNYLKHLLRFHRFFELLRLTRNIICPKEVVQSDSGLINPRARTMVPLSSKLTRGVLLKRSFNTSGISPVLTGYGHYLCGVAQ
jgi:hypothetical protein